MSFKVTGDKGAEAVFDALGKRLGAREMNKILRAAGKPLQAEARRLAPKTRKRLTAKSIQFVPARGGNRGQLIYLGPRKSKGGRTAHLIEYGTGPRTKSNGQSTGSMPARPFMRPAVDAKGPEVIAAIRAGVRELLVSGFKNVKF